jgi:hypothetical protein
MNFRTKNSSFKGFLIRALSLAIWKKIFWRQRQKQLELPESCFHDEAGPASAPEPPRKLEQERAISPISGTVEAEAKYAPSEIWAELLGHWDSETNRFWERNNVFLLINGALIALLAQQGLSTFLGVLAAVLGISVGFIWYQMNVMGKYYIDRWKTPLMELEKNWPVRPVTFVHQEKFSHPTPLRFRPSSTYMQWIVQLTIASWLLVLVYVLARPLFGTAMAFGDLLTNWWKDSISIDGHWPPLSLLPNFRTLA